MNLIPDYTDRPCVGQGVFQQQRLKSLSDNKRTPLEDKVEDERQLIAKSRDVSVCALCVY